jgi:hypothetical protein
MNDLFVPIILSYFPRWNDAGMPVDEDDQIIDYKPMIPKIFWCFEGMLHKTNHVSLLASVTEHCQGKAKTIVGLIAKVSPLVAVWMRQNAIADLLWFYSDFVLLFKRSFENVWPFWLQVCCAPSSEHWLTYFVTAIILQTFLDFSTLPEVSITSLMDVFTNQILKDIDPAKVGKIAQWLYEKYPLQPTRKAENRAEDVQFEFFEASWEQ